MRKASTQRHLPVAVQKPVANANVSFVSLFTVPGMDCPSEENLIRMALEGLPEVSAIEFDLPKRQVRIHHDEATVLVSERLARLGLGARLISSTASGESAESPPGPRESETASNEARVLKILLSINAVMFFVEFATGWFAQSTSLLADSLDMFADATVYGLALYAVGKNARHKLKAAQLSGWFQLLLAIGALSEVVHRFLFGSEPVAPLMMGMAALALVANVACLLLLARHRHGGVHMKASWIFSANDVLANIGVIVAGAAVTITGKNSPDLIIGTAIALLVMNGARRILRLQADQ